MKYADARNTIKTGDVLAWGHSGLRSLRDLKLWLVRLFTASEYVHIGVAWCVADRVFILESVATGVRIFPLSLDLPCFHLTGNGLTPEQLEFALSKAGQPYSYWECVRSYFGRTDAGNGAWECAEYVREVLGLKCDATPAAVVAHLLENGSAMTRVEK